MQRAWMGASAIALGVLLCGSSAFAAQNVGNTSQKGSLLIFPNVDVSPGVDTIVRISNDANSGVDLTCYYINERKGRRDFHFKMTRKQPIWFSVRNHSGTFPVAQFPTDGTFTAFGAVATQGALLCWATDASLSSQISHNHLSGNATLVGGETPDRGYRVAGRRHDELRNGAGPHERFEQRGHPGQRGEAERYWFCGAGARHAI